jgi:acetolactate synthase-1/2/3 large subunit
VTGASYVVRSLVAEGIDHVFMVPGGMNDPFMPAMTDTEGLLDPAVEVLIVLGSPLSQRDTLQWNPKMLPTRELIQVDADPGLIGRTWPASVPVTGSPRIFLERLVADDGAVAAGLERGVATRRAFLAEIRGRGPRVYDGESVDSDAEPMHPARMVSVARAACPPGTVLSVDSGAHRAWCSEYWQSYGDGDYISLSNLGPMGGDGSRWDGPTN